MAREYYDLEMPTTIAGIPCLIGLESYDEGSYSYNAASDWDYYGHCDWVVLDRKGYAAQWLVKKMTTKDNHRIENEIVSYIRKARAGLV